MEKKQPVIRSIADDLVDRRSGSNAIDVIEIGVEPFKTIIHHINDKAYIIGFCAGTENIV